MSAFSISRLAIILVAIRDSVEVLTFQAISSYEVDSLGSYLSQIISKHLKMTRFNRELCGLLALLVICTVYLVHIAWNLLRTGENLVKELSGSSLSPKLSLSTQS